MYMCYSLITAHILKRCLREPVEHRAFPQLNQDGTMQMYVTTA